MAACLRAGGRGGLRAPDRDPSPRRPGPSELPTASRRRLTPGACGPIRLRDSRSVNARTGPSVGGSTPPVPSRDSLHDDTPDASPDTRTANSHSPRLGILASAERRSCSRAREHGQRRNSRRSPQPANTRSRPPRFAATIAPLITSTSPFPGTKRLDAPHVLGALPLLLSLSRKRHPEMHAGNPARSSVLARKHGATRKAPCMHVEEVTFVTREGRTSACAMHGMRPGGSRSLGWGDYHTHSRARFGGTPSLERSRGCRAKGGGTPGARSLRLGRIAAPKRP